MSKSSVFHIGCTASRRHKVKSKIAHFIEKITNMKTQKRRSSSVKLHPSVKTDKEVTIANHLTKCVQHINGKVMPLPLPLESALHNNKKVKALTSAQKY